MPEHVSTAAHPLRERLHIAWDLDRQPDAAAVRQPVPAATAEAAFEAAAPGLHALYERHIHANFVIIDLACLAVFLADARTERITEKVLIDMLEVLKAQLGQQRWKTRYE